MSTELCQFDLDTVRAAGVRFPRRARDREFRQEKFLAYGSPNLVPKLWHTRPPLCKIVRRRWMALSPGRYSRLLKLSEQTRRDQNERDFLCRAHDDRYLVAIHWQRGRPDLQQYSKTLVRSHPPHPG